VPTRRQALLSFWRVRKIIEAYWASAVYNIDWHRDDVYVPLNYVALRRDA
jgi:hypothetical protein